MSEPNESIYAYNPVQYINPYVSHADTYYPPTRREMFVMAAMGTVRMGSIIAMGDQAITDVINYADAVMKRLDEEGK